MYKPPMDGPQTQPPLMPGTGSVLPVQPKAGLDMKIYDPTRPQYQPAIPQSVEPMRQRLAEAILKATTPPADQPVQHPLQALGNASNQIAGAYLQKKAQVPPAGRSLPAPGSPTTPPRGGPGAAYYSQAKGAAPMRPMRPPPQRPIARPQQGPTRRPPFPGG